jgi:ABC-type sulfate transport system substrate-binding protein
VFGKEMFEVVYPSLSFLAAPTIAIVDANVDKNGTRKVAEAYLAFLYTPEAQAAIARHGYRPRKPEAAAKEDLAKFKDIELVTVDADFGGWAKAQQQHFGDGGTFDEIYKPSN